MEQRRGCFLEGLAGAPALESLPVPLVIEFSICASGDFADLRVGPVSGESALPPEVAASVDRAIQACRWFPARSERGLVSSRLSLILEVRPRRLRPSWQSQAPAESSSAPAPECGQRPPAASGAAPGHTAPRTAVQGCVSRAFTLPRDLDGLVGRTTARFRVGADGCLGGFQLVPSIGDRRILEGLERAARSCTWIPGTDPQGRPVDMEVTLPVRFKAQSI
jgi:hypothetical protein